MFTRETRSYKEEPMTKDEFLEGIGDMVQDMADPRGDWQAIVTEGSEISAELKRFDPVLAQKFDAIVASISDFGAYVKDKAEFLGIKGPSDE